MKIYLQADKIFIANTAIDFRKSLDGLCALISEDIREDPTEGIYIFYNRSRNRLKVIGRHTNGFIMLYKRLDEGKFFVEQSGDKIRINRQQLDWLLLGANWKLLSENKCKYNTYL
jgi:transposase